MGEAGLPHELPFPLTDTDRYVLSQTDEEYKYHDWAELKNIIETNNLSVLKRKPSDLRKYIRWSAATRNEYGSMTKYLLVNRLPRAWGEPPFSPMSQTPFQDASDYRVLVNDWPYGFTAGIVHIVVWSRTIIPTDPTTGDMTPESRKIVADFVESYFVDRLGPGGQEKVLWFKNWVALQSVRALEHIHVMVRDVPAEIVQEWAQEQACHKLDGTAGS